MPVTRRKRTFTDANLEVEVGYANATASKLAGFAETGTVNAPQRAVLGPMLEEMRPTIRRMGAAMMRAMNRGRTPLHAARELAEDLEDALRRHIDEVQPGNAPSTIAQKGFDDPLRGPSRPGEEGDRIYKGVTSKVRRL